MNSSLVLSVTTFVYGLAAFLYLAAWVFQKNALNRSATWVAVDRCCRKYRRLCAALGGILPNGDSAMRRCRILYESLVFFAWMIAVHLFDHGTAAIGYRTIGAFAMPSGLSVHGLCLAVAQTSATASSR
ncbi:MAG: hypothetical protein MZV70_74910 [Desulfobacterales bacterium]|nr:hypothetical protein [Desulfobacterales bacterium]